ncbi:MAG TPA: hypothetical protein VHO07_26420 [Streptosporangiaceae bacterium]|nr:hypothetical protein [Streptosporangiaceae bacterium]
MNWTTVADLATALGTLILAVATFSAVKSSNLMARVAQQSLLVGLRPVLGPQGHRRPPAVDGGAALRRPRGRAAMRHPVHHDAAHPRGSGR